ncbi:MAG TPA: preprotein translocase subunit YajC [Terriglobales bacterium]|nr:preprotein translocase subunit YajC [Terriglobales bacterium]
MHDVISALLAIILQTSGGSSTGWGGLGALPVLLLMFAIFYFLLILPQQRRQKKWQAMLSSLKNGDRVVTQGGISGTIIALRDQFVHLRVPPDNIKLEVARSSVVSVVNPEEQAKS